MDKYLAARTELLEWLAHTLNVPADRINLHQPLAQAGIDSLDAVHMIATIESIIRQELPEDVIQRVTCLNDIFEMMRERMAAA